MSKSLKFCLAQLLIIFLLTQSLSAVARPLASQQPEVVVSVLIRNEGAKAVSFSLKNKRGEWKEHLLDSKLDKPYKDVIEIWIPTEGGAAVHYKLEEENRYVIYWNERRGLWDVAKQSLR